MSQQVEFGVGSAETYPQGEAVRLVVSDIFNDRYVDVELTPGEAVRFSRALVNAAAEALGVKV